MTVSKYQLKAIDDTIFWHSHDAEIARKYLFMLLDGNHAAGTVTFHQEESRKHFQRLAMLRGIREAIL